MSDFQHRHYARVAALIGALRSEEITVDGLTERFARMFQDDNPRFDYSRFISAANNAPMGKDADTAGVKRKPGMPYR